MVRSQHRSPYFFQFHCPVREVLIPYNCSEFEWIIHALNPDMLLILNQLRYDEIFRVEIFRIIFAKILVKIVFYLIINKKSHKTIRTISHRFCHIMCAIQKSRYFLGK